MCGIAGYYGIGESTILQKMGDSLTHRGPDAGGTVVLGSVGLAHRRLSIIDLSEGGSQPMSDASGRFTIVYNGEIFNFKELQKKYIPDTVFRGTSDTEIIIELFSNIGIKTFSVLQGMYALAIYDSQTKELFLARDSLGKKPLYYSLTNGALLFGSELKALRCHPACPKALDETAIAQYLFYEYIPAPRTIYKEVYKLLPKHYAVYDGQTFKQHEVVPTVDRDQYSDNPCQNFEELMADCVAKRLVADVPVGVFLSGGLDSSTVAYFAQKATSEKIKTFSVGFTDKSFDEQDDARLVARHLGTDHYDLLLGVSEIRHVIKDLPFILDEPMADSSIVPTTLVSKFASEKVKVCLSGDGADELFHGYGTFYAHQLARYYRMIPSPIQSIITTAVEKLPVSHTYMSLDFKLKRFVSGLATDPVHTNAVWLSAFSPEAIATISDNKISISDIFAPVHTWHQEASSLSEGIQQEYLKGYLTEDILVKVDRASMHHSLEVRSPFLDERMVSFALSLEETWKLRGNTGKYLIKSVMENHLPKEIVWKKKKGFNIPIGRLIIEDMKSEFTEVILNGPLSRTGLCNREKLAILLQQHWEGKYDYRKQIWSLYVLSRWLDTWHE